MNAAPPQQGPQARVERLSKGFYLGSYIAAGVLVWVMGVVGAVSHRADIGLYGLIPSIYLIVVHCVFWYKAWASIQDGSARATPCRAIGFMFIPFFNLYWIFQAIWGFARDYNSYIARHVISVPTRNESVFLALCIMAIVGGVLGWVPVLGFILGAVTIVLMIVVISTVCDAINSLPEATAKA